uniref:Uncharacterized protein n=1 Tax=Physcomitrium patens TaxID=3218 RepID=A0A2K1KJN6_PHYPA|nr:hypothetical protein PHYPA_007664 [Physcomitrium patens]
MRVREAVVFSTNSVHLISPVVSFSKPAIINVCRQAEIG